MDSQARWDAYFMDIACLTASKSKDNSIKVGTVIVGHGNSILSTGYNGFPRGIDDAIESRNERPEKYLWTEHAERNAVYNAALNGVKLMGSKVYSTSFPCSDCARAFIQSGITKIMIPNRESDAMTGKVIGMETNDATFTKAAEILEAAGVTVHHVV